MTNIGFGQGDKKILRGGDLNYYKGEKNRKDVVSFGWFYYDEDGNPQIGDDINLTPRMIMSEIHYIKGLGYVLDNDYLRSKLGPPKRKIGTFLVHYVTNRRGEIQKPVEFEIKPWQFGEDKYRRLADMHQRFNLTSHDFEIRCDDDTFQKLQFTPIPGGSLWQKKDEWKQEVLEMVKDLEGRLSIGREVPLEELKDHFGDDVSPAPDASSGVDYDDLMDGIE